MERHTVAPGHVRLVPVAAGAAAALLLLACAVGDRTSADNVKLIGTDWTLLEIEGTPTVPGWNVTLKFDSTNLGGYGGCNWYGSRYSQTGSMLSIGQVESTARFCASLEQEQRVFRALERAVSFRLDGDRLQLRDSADVTLLKFETRVHHVMNAKDLDGTRWSLARIDSAVVVSDPPITLQLTGGWMSGFGGCRNYTGRYTATGDEIRFLRIEMGSMECKRGADSQRSEESFTTQLGEASHYLLAGDTLTVFTFPGRRVVFVRR